VAIGGGATVRSGGGGATAKTVLTDPSTKHIANSITKILFISTAPFNVKDEFLFLQILT